mmetsp:Transcript_78014/g.252519  ORF Transcript_78014/g.252519 Transcript_78014/m.252519 type:complete len:205 (-) Transcript_78014:31-645(-)
MSRMARSHLFTDHHGPVRFHKIRKSKEQRSPVLYGWHHNNPWSRYNNFAYFWSEHRPIRKTVVNHAQRVKQVRAFGQRFDMAPWVVQELSQQGPFTLFCPTDEAMGLIRESAWAKLWDEEQATFLRHHAVKGRWGIADLVAACGQSDALVSMAELPLSVAVQGSLEEMTREVRVAGAAVTKSNVRCWNGYVHVIDRPLIPPRWL